MRDDIKTLKAEHSETIYKHFFPAWTGNGKKVLCFNHEDHNPSLSIFQKAGEYRHHCHPCGVSGDCLDLIGQLESIPDAGHRIGRLKEIAGKIEHPKTQRSLSLADIQKIVIDGKYKFDRYHTYKAGNPPYIKALFKNSAGEKKGLFYTVADKGRYVSGRKSMPVFYNQERITDTAKVIFISESEKDCDTIFNACKFLCITSGGATSWGDKLPIEILKDKSVILLAHNDLPGVKYAETAAQSLKGIATSIKIINPETWGAHKGADSSDWITARQAEGKTAEGINIELRAIIKASPEWQEPKEKDFVSLLPTLSDLAAMDLTVDYALEGIIPEKAITVLYGRGGRGKTTLMLQAGYCIAEGLPFEGLKTKQMPVIYCDWDNPLNVICDKAKRLGSSGNFHYWHSAFNEPKLSKLDKAEWEIFKKLPNNALLIFDTLKSCQGLDMNRDETMAFVLERFRELRDLGFTIVILHHTPRGEERPKNNTTITDNADHSIGIISAKPSATGEEGEDGLLFFGCGEADKSRYAKHYIYLSFDGEVFERVQDPEDSKFESMRNLIEALIKEGVRPNQSKITEAANKKLNLNVSKTRDLLNKGEGKHWKSTRIKEERNQKIYELIQFFSFQTLYSGKTEKLPENQFLDRPKTETLQTLDAVEFASFPDPPKKTEKLPENQFSDKPVFQDALLKTESIFIDAEVE